MGAIALASAPWAALASQAPPDPVPEPRQDHGTGTADPPQENQVEFVDAEGNPLPAERQQQLSKQWEEELDPPPDMSAPSSAERPSPIGADGSITVSAERPRGSVVGNTPPERSFSPIDVRAYGATSIGELLQTLGPQVTGPGAEGDSAPIVLLNGKRVSSFTEIARLPTEAIEKVEVFPEELALQYGYRADQKVVNIITFERFAATVGQVSYAVPTRGGRDTLGLAANYLRIAGDTRFALDAEHARSGYLTESERDVRRALDDADAATIRSLLPRTRRSSLAASFSGEWIDDISSSLSARVEDSRAASLLGRAADPAGGTRGLGRDVDTRSVNLGLTAGGPTGRWNWSVTGTYDRGRTVTSSDGTNGITGDEARFVDTVADVDLLLGGPIAALPSGPVTASISIGASTRDFAARSIREETDLARDGSELQASFDIPLMGRKVETSPLGDLSANTTLSYRRLSDFGDLLGYGVGLVWSPVEALRLTAEMRREEGAPTVEQLGAPAVTTPGVRTFDLPTGRTVEAARTFGGNPALKAEDRALLTIGLALRPLADTDLAFSLDYSRTRTDDPIAVFPAATSQLESAFPDRFTRDAAGRLLQIDARPLNFATGRQEALRAGIDFSRPLGPVPETMRGRAVRFAPSAASLQSALPPGARIVEAPPGSAAARGIENASSRLTLSLYYTLAIADEFAVREAGPMLDLLDGAALDQRGGRPRHQVQFRAGAFRKGLGARLAVDWRSGTSVRGVGNATTGGMDDLSFSDLATVNLTLFANLAERLGGDRAPSLLKGTRVTFAVNNLFDADLKVRDAGGAVPLAYQADILDPLGRTVSLGLRKLF